MLRELKPYVERFPRLASTYRTLRDAVATLRLRPLPTPLGFLFAGSEAMQLGVFEPEETALVRELLESRDVLIDVGANIGYYTCLARSLGKRVVAVEPMPVNLDCLYVNLEANAFTDVEVFPVGVSSRPGIVTMFGGGTGASFVERWSGASPLQRRSIPVSTLDILLGDRFAADRLLVKIDVEGAELEVLRGASGVLAAPKPPAWLVEICLSEHHPDGINPVFAETFRLFWDHGYVARAVGAADRASGAGADNSRPVTPEDVARWVSNKRRDFGHHSYLFTKDAGSA
jgi:FkbM family methyltransferase